MFEKRQRYGEITTFCEICTKNASNILARICLIAKIWSMQKNASLVDIHKYWNMKIHYGKIGVDTTENEPEVEVWSIKYTINVLKVLRLLSAANRLRAAGRTACLAPDFPVTRLGPASNVQPQIWDPNTLVGPAAMWGWKEEAKRTKSRNFDPTRNC